MAHHRSRRQDARIVEAVGGSIGWRAPQRSGQMLDVRVIGEERFELTRQLRIAGQQLPRVRRLSGPGGVQVGGDDFIQLFFTRGALDLCVRHSSILVG